jgi:hypothetical protein
MARFGDASAVRPGLDIQPQAHASLCRMNAADIESEQVAEERCPCRGKPQAPPHSKAWRLLHRFLAADYDALSSVYGYGPSRADRAWQIYD